MKNLLLHYRMVTAIFLLCFSNVNFAQTPNLGTTANYVLFTAAGAVGNTGTSVINGNIGTNVGAITGFEFPTVVNGSTEVATTATAQAALDVQVAYMQLMAFPATVTDHTPVFGNGETLSPGVYNIGAAGSIAASLTLDGQGSSDAVFIFQFGGAFTTAASGTVILTNGAMAENVFWGANGAIPMATMTDMQGTLIANGAVSMGDGGTLVGRMLSTVEAVTVYNTIVTLPGFVLPIELLTFTGSCIGQHVVLNWTTASEQDNDYFTVERSLEGQHWQVVGTVDGAGSSTSQQNYTLTDMQPSLEAALYRLKQTDFNAIYQYGDIIVVEKCGEDAATAAVFPNPSNGHFILSFSGDPDEIFSIEVLNTEGQKVFGSAGMPSMMDLSGQAEGVYVVNVQLDSKTIHLKVVVEK